MFSITDWGYRYPAAPGNSSSLAGLRMLSFQFQQWVRLEGSGWVHKTPEQLEGAVKTAAVDCREEHRRSAMKLLGLIGLGW